MRSARRAEREGDTCKDHSIGQLPALVTLLLHFPAGREEPHQRGLTACCCPRAGVISLTAPWACSEPMPACNPSAAGNKSCLKCMLNHSSLLLLLLLLALLLAPSGLGPQSHLPAFWAWGGIRKAKKIAKVTQYGPRKPSGLKHDALDLQAYLCREVSSFQHSVTQGDSPATDPRRSASDGTDQPEYLWQGWTLGGLVLIPIYTPRGLFQPLNWFYMCKPVSAIRAKNLYSSFGLNWAGFKPRY